MNEVIKLILSLSLSGSILAVGIFALKPFIKNKLAKSIQYYIWLIVLLRLVLPFSFEGSIMNNVFYGEQTTKEISFPSIVMPIDDANKSVDESTNSSSILPNVNENASKGYYNADTDHSRHLRDLFNQYALYLWLIGVIIVLTANLAGYIRFVIYLKQANKPTSYEETQLLTSLVKGRSVRLVRNHFVPTPLLIGIFRPRIIIPDINFNESQLKNILLHELSHLRRFDIGVKWLTMIAASIHWFNPIMYFIKKEIDHACELACDEAVIRDFNSAQKQKYGETLINVVAENRYSLGVLQATMCEEKRSLKERLIAIMNHNKKSRFMIVFSVVLFGTVIFGAAYLGAGVGIGKGTAPNIYISDEEGKTKALIGTYNLAEIAKHKTPYLGDSSKVSAIVGQLPEPDNYFKQRYISMETDGTNKLNVFYEAKEGTLYSNEWSITNPESPAYYNMKKNALVLFCMIDNLDKVTFAFRDSQSDGKLDTSKYNTAFNFSRASVQEQFGNLLLIGGDLEKLQDALAGENVYEEPEFTNQEIEAARSVVEEYFHAVKEKDSQAILKTLTPVYNHPSVVLYGEEVRTLLTGEYNPEDPMRQSYITSGRGRANGIKKENVIVFKVSFNVEYPNGVTGAFNEGEYKNWSVILIRNGKESPWFIDDQGY